jgi:hypothetical protein
MSKSISDIAHEHGQEMYILGLKHAVELFKLEGTKAIAKLEAKMAEQRKELDDERTRQVQRTAPQ